MNERQADDRSLNFAGDVDGAGNPLPMTYAVLEASAAKWPVSPQTPDDIASLLARSRQMFTDGYYTYESFADAAAKSLLAIEAALRIRLGRSSGSFSVLIGRARATGLVSDYAHDVLHAGRNLRNNQVHATASRSGIRYSRPTSSERHINL
jgi:hypothetical protein